ncbi:anosmin-1-like [Musca domestica]|uniref:Anosmin-1-like n=1 Tax=Musca domestica TaxID=7370 RepID=A0ABM3V6E3_MUSDO|nr:anosmin-1-like [Musca domestica]
MLNIFMLKILLITLWILNAPTKALCRHHGRSGGGGLGGGRYRSSQMQHIANIDVRDKILELQCYAKCQDSSSSSSGSSSNGGGTRYLGDCESCRKQCQIDMIKAPRRGYCPVMQNAIFQNINIQPLQKLSCLDNCSYDFDCPEVQKCCSSACGPVCMQPIGVRDDSLLPPIPKILKCTLIARELKVEITLQSNSSYYFHVEIRHHIGSQLSPRKLSAWQYQPVELLAEVLDLNRMLTTVGFYLRPGRWYQVRVAAINAYGFRGYSEPSQAFTLPNHPKPPKPPADLKVVSSHYDGQRVTIKIVWCASKSNLPIEKYKIIWSLYVNTFHESFVSNEAYVKDRHQYEITKLIPDSSYYIQVQALSINGRKRLKSEKHSILYNTTIVPTQTFEPLKCGRDQQQQQPHQQQISTRDSDGLSANALSSIDERYYTKKYSLNDASLADTPSTSSLSIKNSTYSSSATTSSSSSSSSSTKSMDTFEVKYRLNRKLGMLVVISGFHPKEEKIYELCPLQTNCEEGEYNAIRVNKDSLVFSKLSYNTVYTFKPRSNSVNDMDGMKAITFTTPKCENFRKGFPKANIKC